MKKIILFFVALSFFAACQQTEDEKAAPLMNTIDSLYKAGNYQATLNAITRLRAQHPKAIESRERQYNAEKNLYRKNMLRVKRDSLQTRYEALCGTVLVIHRRQAEK